MAVKGDYFRLPSTIMLVSVPMGLLLTAACELRPDLVPHDYMGPVGWLSRYLVEQRPGLLHNIFLFAVIAHTTEPFAAMFIARRKGLTWGTTFKWFFSTIIFGITSLSHLLKYKPGSKKTS